MKAISSSLATFSAVYSNRVETTGFFSGQKLDEEERLALAIVWEASYSIDLVSKQEAIRTLLPAEITAGGNSEHIPL